MRKQPLKKLRKSPKLLLINLLAFLFISFNSFSQKEETWKDVIISELDKENNEILFMFDKEEFRLKMSDDILFRKKKKKMVNMNDIFPGTEANISFITKNSTRIVTKVQITVNEDNESKFEGVFESFEEGIAIIDGRKVKLLPGSSIHCDGNKECDCTKGRSFLGFEELSIGSFLTVDAKQNGNGIYEAKNIEVCRNKFTNNDQQLMTAIANSFNATSLTKVSSIPANIYAPVHGLHQGNIKVGDIDYKLLDNIKVQGYVNLVGNRILPDYAKEESYSEKHHVIFRFYVIDNEIPNAMAFPNGMIFINTGLLKIMENEAQLATVLGHEIAHITHEHGAKRFKTAKIAESGLAKKGMNLAKNIFRKKTALKEPGILESAFERALELTTPRNISNLFNKKKETQSDRVGLFYMFNNGYDVREAARFWQNMMLLTKNETFMGTLTNKTFEMLNTVQTEIDGKDFLSTLGEKGTIALVGSILETIYTSHPRSIKRYGDINKLLATTYKNAEMDQYIVGKEEFEKYMSTLE
jgi:Zn-dependent protease with chaperone function